jgi:hypothetical protein
MRSRSIMKLHKRRPRNFDITNVGYGSYMQYARGDYRLAVEKRTLAKNVRQYFKWHLLKGGQYAWLRNYIAASYSSARMTTEEAMIKQVGQWVFRRLTPQANMRLAEPLILEELRRATGKGPWNKAPGADGILHEFYVHFWDVITTDLLTIYNSILQNRDLSANPWHDCLCAEASGTAYHERLARVVATNSV